eukprot:3021896-Pyramimonas_sp.AAC.1
MFQAVCTAAWPRSDAPTPRLRAMLRFAQTLTHTHTHTRAQTHSDFGSLALSMPHTQTRSRSGCARTMRCTCGALCVASLSLRGSWRMAFKAARDTSPPT